MTRKLCFLINSFLVKRIHTLEIHCQQLLSQRKAIQTTNNCGVACWSDRTILTTNLDFEFGGVTAKQTSADGDRTGAAYLQWGHTINHRGYRISTLVITSGTTNRFDIVYVNGEGIVSIRASRGFYGDLAAADLTFWIGGTADQHHWNLINESVSINGDHGAASCGTDDRTNRGDFGQELNGERVCFDRISNAFDCNFNIVGDARNKTRIKS